MNDKWSVGDLVDPDVMYVKYTGGSVATVLFAQIGRGTKRPVMAQGFGAIGTVHLPDIDMPSVHQIVLNVSGVSSVLLDRFNIFPSNTSGGPVESVFECTAGVAAILLRGRCPFFTSNSDAIDPFTSSFPTETLIAMARLS